MTLLTVDFKLFAVHIVFIVIISFSPDCIESVCSYFELCRLIKQI